MDIKKKTLNAVKWTTIATFVKVGIGFLQMLILTRLLNPRDFGLMALVTIVIGFSQSFIDMGLSNAVIHKQEIRREQLSSLFWLNIIAGVFIFFVIFIIAPFIAMFYHETELTRLLRIIGLTFLIQPFGQLYSVLWQKELRFKEISILEIITSLISFIVSTVLAFLQFGVYALVWGAISASVIYTLFILIKGLKEHRPTFILKLSEIKNFIQFGLYQMGERIINYFNYQFDSLLIGKLLGMESLGIYSIAKQLVMYPAMIFNPIITRVTFPAMAKIQNDIDTLKEVYKKTINYLSSINFPIYAFMFIFSTEIITILYGKKWLSAIPVLAILSLWGALRSTGNPIGSLLLARGKAALGFYWNLGLFFIVPLVMYIGSRWGLIGLCISMLLFSFPFGMIANWYFLVYKLCKARFWEYHIQILKPALFSAIAAFTTIVVVNLMTFINHLSYFMYLRLIIGGTVGFLIIFLLNYYYNNEFVLDLKEMIKKDV